MKSPLIHLAAVVGVYSTSPYTLQDGSTFHLEAAREQTWPNCVYRFLSFPGSCDGVDLWNDVGINQEWSLRGMGNSTFALQSSCGNYLSYSLNCDDHSVSLSSTPNPSTQSLIFAVGDNTQFTYYINTVGRANCEHQWLSFPVPCTTSTPDLVDLWSAAGPDQRFRLHPINTKTPITNNPVSDSGCADPFSWYSESASSYLLQCTGGGLPLSSSPSMDMTAHFSVRGDSLGGTPAPWASVPGQRWAPENFECNGDVCAREENYAFFSSSSDATGNTHRVGYAISESGAQPYAWNEYSSTYLDLGNTAGGEIDQSVFVDDDGRQYLLWKSDDNNAGMTYTRLWMQEMAIGNASVALLGAPSVVLDSTGLWWVDSWVVGGSLVEGPELIKEKDYYYLFFAAGKYCQDSYSEGVARSKSLWGPYEKMQVPFLSTGIVGLATSQGGKSLIGPGHGSLLRSRECGELFMIFHASLDSQCNRLPFIAGVKFGFDDWPYADF
jgi:arabinan endo-1,5-alpha-L-arabinosidase